LDSDLTGTSDQEIIVSGVESGQTNSTGAEPIRTGLLGREILASRSPWMHQEEARANGLNLTYELFDFGQRDWNDDLLGEQLIALQKAGFAGVNITHPFKQAVIAHLNELAASAQMLGAVNTVEFGAAGMIGHNTDVSGFAESVRRGLAGAQMDRVVQFGAGGAGSATAHALLSLGVSELILVDPDVARAATLAERLKQTYAGAKITISADAASVLVAADGIVNATPIGMAAHPGLPLDPDDLQTDQWVADIVYFPLETALLRVARTKGCRTLDGKGMAVFQAADAFAIFTGVEPDRNRMLKSFDAFAVKQAA
jgi:shikimate dehydrogenase